MRCVLILLAMLSIAACNGESRSDPGSGGAGGSAGAGGASGASGAGGSSGAGQAGGAGSAGLVGSGEFDRYVLHTEFYSEGAAVADFDLDGNLDVVAGPYWYAGPEFTTRHELYPPVAFDPKAYSDNFFAWAHDVDGDGFPDVLSVGFPGQQAAWFENPKTPGAPWPRHVIASGVDNESPEFVDLTGDGAPELVYTNAGRLGWAEPGSDPKSPWTFHPLSPPTGFATFTHGLGVGDVDGDGRLDVLEASGWWQQPAGLAGDPTWTRHANPFVPGGAQMYAFDIDGDGDADVATTREAHGYGISWFEATSGGFVEHAIAPSDPASPDGPILHEPHALAARDMNGDGLTDLVGGERFWGHVPAGDPSFDDPARLYWFELRRVNGSAEFIPHEIDAASGVGTQVTAQDANGDGVPDVVVPTRKAPSSSCSAWRPAAPDGGDRSLIASASGVSLRSWPLDLDALRRVRQQDGPARVSVRSGCGRGRRHDRPHDRRARRPRVRAAERAVQRSGRRLRRRGRRRHHLLLLER